jgi:uncharacterized cupredoxin-like copper-binding protein
MKRVATAALALASFGLIAAGCGSDNGTESTAEPQATAGGGAPSASLTIGMKDNFFVPKVAAAKAGSVKITARNQGQLVHELVLAKTNANPAKLPTTSDGEVDEAKLESLGQDAGEVADVSPGASKAGTFKFAPGNYVMFCNIPGHYAAGMYGTITVK